MNILNKMKYIRNNPLYGMKYDDELVNKDFKRMMKECNAPDGLYDPTVIPIKDARYYVLMSERSSSKTTQTLLKGLCYNKRYGTTIAYIRTLTSQITSSQYKKLFEVINNPVYGYIEWLTDKEYNRIIVERDKSCHYAHVNDEGVIDKICTKWCIQLMAVEEVERYTSTFNTVDTDYIIYDEFSRTPVTTDDFIAFMNIHATLRRERENIMTFMLSNTITPYHVYLKELAIAHILTKMKRGQHAIITAPLGARVYVELLSVGMHDEETTNFKQVALDFYGFANEGLKAIYGGEWEIKGFKHIPNTNEATFKNTNIIFDYMGNYMILCFYTDGKQFGAFIKPFTKKLKPNSIIISDEPHYNVENTTIKNYDIMRKLKALDKQGLLYYADNETGMMFVSLMESIK